MNDHIAHFERAFSSIINQTYQSNDIVLVVDGPISEQLSDTIKRLKIENKKVLNVIYIDNNVGLPFALNIGLEKCKNDYVARMDADDISLPTRFEIQLSYIIKHSLDVLGTQILTFSELDERTYLHQFPTGEKRIRKYIRSRTPLGHPSVMFKKSSVLAVGGYNVSLLNQQDYELWARMISAGYHIDNLKTVLLNMRVDNTSFSKRRSGYRYFSYSLTIQKKLLRLKLTNIFFFSLSVVQRFLFFVIIPPEFRAFLYRKILRKGVKNDFKI